jgi:hypothetical protein
MVDYTFGSAGGGNIPVGALSQGSEAAADGGQPLWLARAPLPSGGTHLGKVRTEFGAALIPYGGLEVRVPGGYEVLMQQGLWMGPLFSGAKIPEGAVVCGWDDDGEPLFAGLAVYPPTSDGLHPGKVSFSLGGCRIGYNGQERKITDNYYVLGGTVSG